MLGNGPRQFKLVTVVAFLAVVASSGGSLLAADGPEDAIANELRQVRECPAEVLETDGVSQANCLIRVPGGINCTMSAECQLQSRTLRAAASERAREMDPFTFTGHRTLKGKKSKIFLLHIWKCGGAGLCDMALRNGEYAPNAIATNVCNRCDANEGASGDVSWHDDWQLVKTLRNVGNYSFVAWQAPLPQKDAMLWAAGLSRWSSMVVLRNPVDQAISHYDHQAAMNPPEQVIYENFEAWMEHGLCRGDSSLDCREIPMKDCKKTNTGCIPFMFFRDNHQLRWLTGLDSDVLGKRPKLNQEALEKAKARLEKFDEVLILEDMHDRDRHRFSKFGWRDLDDMRDPHRLKSTLGTDGRVHKKSHHALQPYMLKRLSEVQRFDLELYEHARKLAKGRSVAHSSTGSRGLFDGVSSSDVTSGVSSSVFTSGEQWRPWQLPESS